MQTINSVLQISSQNIYNELCYQYFGKGYVTNFTDNDIKAGRRVLSYRALHKKENMTLIQMMNIYNHSQAISSFYIFLQYRIS